MRAAYALGGLGSGFANTEKELIKIVQSAFAHTKQVRIIFLLLVVQNFNIALRKAV